MSKLPRSLKLQVSREMPSGKWDVVKVMAVFKRELMARERCERIDKTSLVDRLDKCAGSTSLFIDCKTTVVCAYCSKNHSANQCNVITNITDKKKYLRDNRRCYNCLKPNHIARICYNKNSCMHCKNRHHSSICGKVSKDGGLKAKSNNFNDSKHASVCTENNTILQTAMACVSDIKEGGDYANARLLFDNCSQKTFVTEELCERLRIKPEKFEHLSVKTFGAGEESHKLPVVKIKIKSACGKFERGIEAYVVPKVCSTLGGQGMKVILDKYKVARKMKVADTDANPNKDIDVLLGADVIWNFTDGRIVRLDKDLVAVDTVFGVVFSGSV